MKLERTVAPAAVVSVADAKAHMRVATNADDGYIADLVQQASDFIEGPYGSGLALNEQTWRLHLDSFPRIIRIPIWPVKSIVSIAYTDTDGVQQALTDFDADTKGNPAVIAPVSGAVFPQTKRQFNSVTVEFTAGFDTVPRDLIGAILLLAGHWYENREASVIGTITANLPLSVEAILGKYSVRGFA